MQVNMAGMTGDVALAGPAIRQHPSCASLFQRLIPTSDQKAQLAPLYELEGTIVHRQTGQDLEAAAQHGPHHRQLSPFERVLSSHPPVLESLLAQLPTTSVVDLYHTSPYLKDFLQNYPLAWKALSFRLPQPAVLFGSPGMDTPDSRERQSKQYSLDAFLITVVAPMATRLKSLDLDNTAVSGTPLVSRVLEPRIGTLEHLSVRGCKNVSIKYHIVPFLQMHNPADHPWAVKLALKSLYTYRCRHHRRRPYLPSSLIRRDSDSEPTHELIEICHAMGIWTDTAWCPTPGARCFRRKEYHGNRAAPGTQEVWVPFDRLWRSGNRLGPTEERRGYGSDGRLWEDSETGHDGEALGTDTFAGAGKYPPAHARKSHSTFIDDVKCDSCGEQVLERCETCSIKMHCMGCRKTLCASCAFSRPLPRKRTKTRHYSSLLGNYNPQFSLGFGHLSSPHADPAVLSDASESRTGLTQNPKNQFWWAPGAARSPNLMSELPPDSDSDDDDSLAGAVNENLLAAPVAPLKLNMHWCCLEPIFSGGGGVAFLGSGLGGQGSDRIRAVPLPRLKQYEDPDFQHMLINPESIDKLKNVRLYEEIMGENVDILPYLMQDNLELQSSTCPRSLCQDCYRTFRWRVACRGCKRPLCKEHDFRGLKLRKCGYRELSAEREYVRNPPLSSQQAFNKSKNPSKWDLAAIPAFRRSKGPIADFRSGTSTPLPFTDDGESPAPLMARVASTASSSADSGLVSAPVLAQYIDPSSDLDLGSSLMEAQPRSISEASSSSLRQRSVSLSGLSDRAATMAKSSGATTTSCHGPVPAIPERSTTPAMRAEAQKRHLLPRNIGHPVQWEGCGSYFCQQVRPIGDCRTRCSALIRECGECGVLACEYCLVDTPSCPCTYCSSTFHCPTCVAKPSVRALCTRMEEIKAMEAARERDIELQKKEEEQKAQADDLAVALGEFMVGVEDDD